MESRKPIPSLSKLKQPTVTNIGKTSSFTNIPKAMEINKASLGTRFMQLRSLPRRSKSFSEIRTLKKENVPSVNGNVKQPWTRPARLNLVSKNVPVKPVSRTATIKNSTVTATTTTSKTTTKRPANDKPACESKPKVVKPSKPAPYDYKARFLLSQEKYSALNDKYKGLLHLQAENDNLKKTIDTSNEEFKLKQTKLLEELNQSKTRVTFLEPKYAELQYVTEQNKILLEKLENKLKEEEKLKNLNNELTNKNLNYKNINESIQRNLDTAEERISILESRISTYKLELLNSETLRRSLHNSCQDLKGRIRVFCRIRPLLGVEAEKAPTVFTYIDEGSIEVKRSTEIINSTNRKGNDLKQEFQFDRVFAPECSQAEVFEELAHLVQSALDGYNVCVFAYGQTGSGKTYTMLGTDDHKGMIPKTVELLFKKINHQKQLGWKFEVNSSFLEIYNETIRDLLNPTGIMNHDIKFNEGNTYITNLSVEDVRNQDHLLHLIASSQNNRAVAVTDFNEHSSRSHSVTKISVKAICPESSATFVGSLNLVDLAGSESAKTSERITETKNINKSLSCLGTVMLALRNKELHVPYRNSKLTYLLQSSLGGNSKTLMFVNVSPLEENFNESINSLRFASKVKQVKIGSKRTKVYNS